MQSSSSSSNRRIGVILGQVGAPRTPEVSEIRRYLGEFLSDERIIDLPRWKWLPILHGIVLRTRPRAVRENYLDIWTDEGSPLIEISKAQKAGLSKRLGPQYQVELGLAYSRPTPAQAVEELESSGVDAMVAVPLFPQYSTTTTGSFYDAVMLALLGRNSKGRLSKKRDALTLRTVPAYFDDPAYISVLANSIRRQLTEGPKPDKMIVSFHGLPVRYVKEGDPYLAQCRKTAELLARELGWPKDYYEVAFQSRFGREEWIKPYLQPRLTELYRDGIHRPCIVAPGFTTDCLETLHELGIEGRDLFVEGGGDGASYRVLTCLNAEPEWLDYLAGNIRQHSAGLETT